MKDTVGDTKTCEGTVCTEILAITYFLVYLVLHIFRNRDARVAAQGGRQTSFGLEVMKLAATAMNFAPMLCVLFMGSQIAADWAGVDLPKSATMWMYICTLSVLLQVILVIAAPFLANADLKVVGPNGEVDFVTQSHDLFVCISIVRWAAMTALYIGVAVVCISLWNTDAAPSMTHSLYRFAFIYFSAYLVLWAAITARQLSEGGFARTIRVLSVAKDTVVFCPMLAVLFLESFVRAHSIENKYNQPGEPQSYVQDFMFIGAFALGAQLIMVCLAGFASTPRRDQMGAATQDKTGLSPAFLFGFHLAMAVLYLSVIMVVYGLFTINSGNADSSGAWFA